MDKRTSTTRFQKVFCTMLALILLWGTGAQSAEYYKTLREGDRSEEVRVMQTALNALGYDVGFADGKFGDATLLAVLRFQADHRLEADGAAGSKTLSKLYELYAALLGAPIATTAPMPTYMSPVVTQSPYSTVRTTAYVNTESGSLNLRDMPRSGAVILAKIPKGTAVTVIQMSDEWCVIEYAGMTGYVKRTFLSFDNAQPTATPYIQPTSTPKPTTAPTKTPATQSTNAQVATGSGHLNLRQQARSGSRVLEQIPDGTWLTVTQNLGTWCATSYNGTSGYVMAKYLSFGGGSAPTEKPAVPPTATPVVTTAAPTSPSTGTSGTWARVAAPSGWLNLRKRATKSSDAIESLPSGILIYVTQNLGTWCAVSYNGMTGYVMTQYLDMNITSASPSPSAVPVTAPPTKAPAVGWARVTVPSGNLNLRERATKDSNVLDSLADGTLLWVTENLNVWCAVNCNGISGFVMTEYLDFNTATPTPSPSPSPSPTATLTPTPAPDTAMLQMGSQGEEVSRLQNQLVKLGYTCSITGLFESDTRSAVIEFQKVNGLAADGVAGPMTLAALYDEDALGPDDPPAQLDTDQGLMSGPSKSSVQLLHWFNEIKPNLASGAKLLIYDPATGLGWTLRVYSRGRHCDSEPLTLLDTQIMFRAFGYKNTWTPKPVYVKLPDGRWTLATMHNVPHLSGSISTNGFDGHLCVHFLRDMDECAANDPNYGVTHQKRIRAAWLSMTGIVVE